MIKQYFTDGLIQIAIILSLLRTDLNSYLNSNILSYPEVQEIILGSSAAYTQTNFHNLHNAVHGFSSHPKHIIENELVSSNIFQDLRSLSRFRRFNGLQTDVSAFLAPSLVPPTDDEPSDDNNNQLSSYIADSNEDDAESGIGSTTSQTDSELTEEVYTVQDFICDFSLVKHGAASNGLLACCTPIWNHIYHCYKINYPLRIAWKQWSLPY